MDGRKNSQVSLMDVPLPSSGGISQPRDKLEGTTLPTLQLPLVLQSRALRRYLISAAASTDKLPFLSLLLLLEASGQDDRGQR